MPVLPITEGHEVAVLGGGCFWCVEAVFENLRGVASVLPGYSGGHVDHPSYERVCDKDTGHIEVARVEFDPKVLSYADLLRVFFATHDPTTPGRQGNDVGPQYESAIFWQSEAQREQAQAIIAEVDGLHIYDAPIVTKLIPALLAGCSVIIKPAPESPLDALLLAEMVAELDLPPGVFTVLPGGVEVGSALVSHPGVDKVSFTGSTAAGKAVATACAPNLTKVSLELGGKSAAIILDDADPQAVAAGVRSASLSNSGQICNALTRILIPASRAGEFVDALAAEMASITVGDPADPATHMGPLVTRRQQERVRDYIRIGQDEGARMVLGGTELPDGLDRGWYVRPTLFADADNGMRIAREEIFGPVLTMISYFDDADAVAIANDSDYGLAGSVWTADAERGLGVAAAVHTGTFGVNQGYTMDPFAPFGGVKGSGYGREMGREGLDGYLETKSIAVAAGA